MLTFRHLYIQCTRFAFLTIVLATIVCLLVPDIAHARKRKRSSKKAVAVKSIKILSEREITEGVQYKKLIIQGTHSVHVLEVDISSPEITVFPVKGLDRFTGLEKLSDMVLRRDSIEPYFMLGGINANFWSAYLNKPIGPTIIDGEVVQMHPYKQWSSLFVTQGGEYVIDRITLTGDVTIGKTRFPIQSVNYRTDATGIVLYNSFAGGQVPYLEPTDSRAILKELQANAIPEGLDSTEAEVHAEELKEELEENYRREKLEYSMPRLLLRRIDIPVVNRTCLYRVEKLITDEGIAPMGKDIVVLSLGTDFPGEYPAIGEVISVSFSTEKYADKPFVHAISGTPRLVRNGIAKHEAHIEGSKARRFLHKRLPRTAVGIDKKGKKLFLVAVDGADPRRGTRGMTLQQLANAMKIIGSHNAINLDGGGSTSMVVENENVITMGGGPFARKVSVGMVVAKCCKNPESEE
jgi:exopolysaccharide biosynthesis protein